MSKIERSGQILLDDGSVFYWREVVHREIGGHIESPNGNVVRGTAGWYRTTNEHQAANLAALCRGFAFRHPAMNSSGTNTSEENGNDE